MTPYDEYPDDDQPPAPPARKRQYRYTIGSIVTQAIFRTGIVIGAALLLYEYVRWIDYSLWWGIAAVSVGAFVLYPISIQYRMYKEETRRVLTGTLCSSCRHFEETSVLCQKLDEHVTEVDIPCGGELWEPLPPRGEEDEG